MSGDSERITGNPEVMARMDWRLPATRSGSPVGGNVVRRAAISSNPRFWSDHGQAFLNPESGEGRV